MLNARNIRTRFDRPMSINIVQYMLSNRKYIGEFKYRDIVVPHGSPAIISEDLFERVQKRIAKNKKAPARHKAEDDYLLTTKLFCGHCGAYMIGESGTGRNKLVHHYYKCVNTKRRKTCNKKVVKKDWIENLVVREAARILADDKVLENLTDTLYEMQMQTSSKLPRLKQQLADVEKGIENMVNAIQQGILTSSTKERLDKLEAEKKEIEISIVQEQIRKPILTKEFIMFGICKFRKLDLDTREGKQRLIDGFVNAVYLYDDKIILTFNYKDGTKTISLADIDGSDLDCLGGTIDTRTNGNVFVRIFICKKPYYSGFLPFCPLLSPASFLYYRSALLLSQLS